MWFRFLLPSVLLLQGGCGFFSRSAGPGPARDTQVSESVRTQLKDKRFIVVVYEGVTKKDTSTENVFRFKQSALVDEALVELKQKVSDRGPIQSILEGQRLPESGSFKGEDLVAIGKASGAEVLIMGFYATTVKEGFLTSREEHKMILRAVNLQTLQIINSVQAESRGDGEWKQLVRVLFRER